MHRCTGESSAGRWTVGCLCVQTALLVDRRMSVCTNCSVGRWTVGCLCVQTALLVDGPSDVCVCKLLCWWTVGCLCANCSVGGPSDVCVCKLLCWWTVGCLCAQTIQLIKRRMSVFANRSVGRAWRLCVQTAQLVGVRCLCVQTIVWLLALWSF